jgi:hypothetical protein
VCLVVKLCRNLYDYLYVFFQYIIKELIYVFSVFLMGDTLELFLFFVMVTVSLNVNFFLEKWVSLCFV